MKEKNIFRGFKLWLRRQSQNKELDYFDGGRCWLAKFLRSKRVKFHRVSGSEVIITPDQITGIPFPAGLAEALSDAEPFTPANILKELSK